MELGFLCMTWNISGNAFTVQTLRAQMEAILGLDFHVVNGLLKRTDGSECLLRAEKGKEADLHFIFLF